MLVEDGVNNTVGFKAPVPLNGITWVGIVAFAEKTLSEAVRMPTPVGTNCKLIVHAYPAFNAVPGQLFPSLKSPEFDPVTVTETGSSGTNPVLVANAEVIVLAVSITCGPNVKLDG
jgi:hypothetical protein